MKIILTKNKVMTKQDKQLLLKDLCSRLPYGVKCDKDGGVYDLVSVEIPQGFVRIKKMVNNLPVITTRSILREDVVKPYLRPMSSMTEEELYDWTHTWIMDSTVEKYDWLYQHHLDFRGLIPMNLALPAPEGMYN